MACWISEDNENDKNEQRNLKKYHWSYKKSRIETFKIIAKILDSPGLIF